MIRYKTTGTCARAILIDTHDGVIQSVQFEGGCNGNLQGIARLVAGMKAEDVIGALSGIQCRSGTSCPDQLSRALQALKSKDGSGR